MRRILVVAHRTLGGEHLAEEVRRRIEEARLDGGIRFHILVPETHPGGAWTDGQVHRMAAQVLDEGLERFRSLDPFGCAHFTGEVGDANPVYAVDCLIRRGERYDEVLLSTLPHGFSKWLGQDVPRRLARTFTIPVTHVIAEREHATA